MFRIGDFSRLARVTIRTLHHYDEAGLLQPAHVDHRTGYRYYTATQLQTLQRILLLKDLGFALDDIRDLLGADCPASQFLQRLEERRAQLAESISSDQSRLRRLEALRDSVAGAVSADVPAVTLREMPAIEVHSIRERVPRLGTPVQSMFEAAEAAVASPLSSRRQPVHDLPRSRLSRSRCRR
jgi:DNA-binding transcriptional MerR regulator